MQSLLSLWQDQPGLFAALAAVFGACMGSFLTLASWRLPRDKSLISPGSHCPNCSTPLRAPDLVPILSWAAMRAKCRHCAGRIHWRYPAIELVCAAGFALIASWFGPTLPTLLVLILWSGVLLLIITDLEHWIIPDEVHLVLLPAGLWFRHLIFPEEGWSVLLGPVVGLGIGLILHYGYYFLRKRHGLGLGDVKLLATAGAWIGMLGLVPFLFYGGLLGVLFALVWRLIRRGQDDAGYFPFGPALAVSLLLGVVWPPFFGLFWTWPQLLHD